jgi:endonuclease I
MHLHSTLKLLFFFWSFSVTAQGITPVAVSPQVLNFGTQTEKETDSLSVTFQNNMPCLMQVRLQIPFSEYGSRPFYLKSDTLLLLPNQSAQVWVYGKIVHNTLNKSSLIASLNSLVPIPNGEIRNPLGSVDVGLTCQGQFSKSYYSTTQNLAEEALKQALKTRLALNYQSFSYDVARDKMYASIDNRNDSVTCVYTNRKAKFNTRSGASSNNFNCEHTFPQGFFNQDVPMRSDIHHLFSTDDAANNSRGNLPFGTATAPFVQVAVNAPSKNGGGKYEPQDSHKGNCARAMMYFVLRYQDYTNFYASQDTVLRRWHRTFGPNRKDSLRNELVFGQQNNRNPFIDYPQFESRIRSLTALSTSDSTIRLAVSDDTLLVSEGYGGTLMPGDFFYVVFSNPGNKAVTVQNLLIQDTSSLKLLNPAETSFRLGKNESKRVGIRVKAPWASRLTFTSNAPGLSTGQVVFTEIPVSSKPLLDRARIRLAPNPAGEWIAITLPADRVQATQTDLLDATGRVIRSQTFSGVSAQFNFPLSGLRPGYYLIRLRQGSEVVSLPILHR